MPSNSGPAQYPSPTQQTLAFHLLLARQPPQAQPARTVPRPIGPRRVAMAGPEEQIPRARCRECQRLIPQWPKALAYGSDLGRAGVSIAAARSTHPSSWTGKRLELEQSAQCQHRPPIQPVVDR